MERSCLARIRETQILPEISAKYRDLKLSEFTLPGQPWTVPDESHKKTKIHQEGKKAGVTVPEKIEPKSIFHGSWFLPSGLPAGICFSPEECFPQRDSWGLLRDNRELSFSASWRLRALALFF